MLIDDLRVAAGDEDAEDRQHVEQLVVDIHR
jgi:hypothetical protein